MVVKLSLFDINQKKQQIQSWLNLAPRAQFSKQMSIAKEKCRRVLSKEAHEFMDGNICHQLCFERVISG
jgi:hypothetical protein